MEIINKIKGWAAALADVGVSLIALGIVLEVLFSGQNVPFWPDISVIANVQSIIAGFSAQGLVGLVEFGLPVGSATIMGVFIYIILKYILESVIGQVNSIHGIIMGLDNRIKTMNNDMIKLDVQISDALDLRQDEDRIARADGKTDARKD